MKRIKTSLEESNRIYYLVFPVLAIIFLLFESPYTSILNPYYGYDSAVFMVVGKGWSKGFVPYRDLFDHKGPFLYLMNALGFSIYDKKLGVLIIQTIFMTATLFLIYKIGRLYLKKVWSWIIVFVFMFLYCAMISEGNMTEEWSLPFTLIPIYLSLSYLGKEKPVEQHPYVYSFIYGICFGLHAMIRINNAACLCGLVLAFSFLLLRKKQIKKLFINAVMMILGIGMAVLPFVLYFYSVGALNDFIYANFVYNLLYASDGSSAKSLFDWLLVVFRLISLPISIWFGYKLCKNEKLKTESLICGSCMMVVAASTMFLGYGYLHYYLVYVPIMLVGLSWSIRFLSDICTKNGKKYTLTLLLVFIIPFSWSGLRHIGKNILFDFRGYYDAEVKSVNDIVEQIPLDETDSVWSYDVPPKFYLYADITPCYKYFTLQSFQSQGNEYIQPGIEELMNNDPPKWIIMNEGGTNNEFLNSVLRDRYVAVNSVDYGLKLELYQLAK